MSDSTNTARIWRQRSLFAAIGLSLLYAQLLPLGFTPPRWPAPDGVVLLCVVWSLRRPEYAPLPLIAALLLFADLLLMRPPGLLAALGVLACHGLRQYMPRLHGAHFTQEWFTAALAMAGMACAQWAVLGLVLLPLPPLAMTLAQLLSTIAAYPVVVMLCALLFGLRRPSLPMLARGSRQR
ncbi:MAG: rod shape-determining protein MreD [Rhodobacteraceae bacterium]|nr:rod shape-determining protein MreD [Paracoccaceae bacterium]